ncbi:MAG: di-heme-cytochrome C peroxidase [Nevskia sp.]|nr:di-heme-cytochrome C peroxidase [Nevskia sp.]
MRKPFAGLWRWIKEAEFSFFVVRLAIGAGLVLVLLPLLLWIAAIAIAENGDVFRDHDAGRGAATVKQDPDVFKDGVDKLIYPGGAGNTGGADGQNWTAADSLWFYTTTQGSDLIPYDFFMALEQPGSTELFRSDRNMDRYRYLIQKATRSNPDALPVGFVKDRYKGVEYMGFSCAACHTGQVNYKGTGIRIDGGPSMADMDGFLHGLADALLAAANLDDRDQCKDDVCKRFVQHVLARGNYADAAAVTAALKTYSQRIALYSVVNHSDTAYGYARLDAFGRIFNRTLEFVADADQLRADLPQLFSGDDLKDAQAALEAVLKDSPTDHLVARFAAQLDQRGRKTLLDALFSNPPNAPVSYPFLWDIPQHDYVQWNGLASNAGLGPVGRNAGEVVGVFATLDWQKQDGVSLSSLIEGQGFETHVSFVSSVNVHNLRRIEQRLVKLESPQWPESILGPIDRTRAARGATLFAGYCAVCHAEIHRDDASRRIVAHMSRLADIGTDPRMARNSVEDVGESGMLRNLYASTISAGDILLTEKAPVAALLTKATLGTVADPYPYRNPYQRVAHWAYDLLYALFTNDIKASIKSGDYDPDTTQDPYASVRSYKGRSLNGIWATAPYLHNGSVPTLYDLLLPKREHDDPAGGEYRPDSFQVGSREYDPVKAGYVSGGYTGFTFDASLPGNCNAGHEYGTIHGDQASTCSPAPAGKEPAHARGSTRPPLTKEQRLDLLEYLKTL